VCYGGVLLKSRFGYDDTLDAFGVHGVGGAAGALLTGVFCSLAWNKTGADGVIKGNFGQLGTQALATGAAVVFAAVMTFVILKVIEKLVGLRVEQEDEYEGLDLNLHGEQGYAIGGATGHAVSPREEREAVTSPAETRSPAAA